MPPEEGEEEEEGWLDKQGQDKLTNMDTPSPLLSLRLLVPPLRFMTAFMWQVAHNQNVEHFGKLEAFVSVVLKILPDLLSSRQKVTLMMGLRTKMLLQMCRSDAPPNPKTIRSQLSEMQARHLLDSKSSELESMQSHLLELVLSLLEDPLKKESFFKRVYPVEYGADFDKALQALVGYFISRLEKFLPVPNFKQVSSWVDSTSLWEECEQHLSQLEHLHTLSQNYHGDLGETDHFSTVEDRIMSSLSFQHTPGKDHHLTNLQRVPSQDLQSPSSHELQDENQRLHRYNKSHGDEDATSRALTDVSDVQEQTGPSMNKTHDDKNDMGDTRFGLDLEKETLNQSNVPSVGLGRGNTHNASESILSGSVTKEGDGATVKTTGKLPSLSRGQQQGSLFPGGTVVQTVVPLQFMSLTPVNQATEKKMLLPLPNPGVNPAVAQQKIILVVSNMPSINTKDAVKGTVTGVPSQNAAGSSGPSELRKLLPKVDLTQKGNLYAAAAAKRLASLAKRWKCTHCSKCFKYHSDLLRHQYCHRKGGTQRGRDPSSVGTNKPKARIQCSQLKGSVQSGPDTSSVDTDKPEEKCLPYECVTCGLRLPSRDKWRRHRRSHMPDGPPFKCVHCGKEFIKLSGFRTHQQVRADQRDPSLPPCLQQKSKKSSGVTKTDPGQCRFCGKIFPGAVELRSHLRTHPEYKPYQCELCDKTFPTKSVLLVHMETHTGEKPYLCSDCGRQYYSLHRLNKHMRFHERARQQHHCPVCNKQFTQRGAVTVHMRQHTGEKPYGCSVCEKAFASTAMLQVHMRTHTGERPYRCEVCDQCFVTSSSRLSHMRVHSGEKPFTCVHCEKRFTHKTSLKKHMHVHTGVKPFKCPLCPKSYITRNHLNRHSLTHKADA